MNCPHCQTPNRDIARYCRACGLWLMPRCPFCNAEIPPSAFCDQCGRRISEAASQRGGELASQGGSQTTSPLPLFSSSPPLPLPSSSPSLFTPTSLIPETLAAKLHAARETRAMEGERRVVTMLFCDVKGSTEAASALDPEEWAGIINGAFACMIAPVYTYEGIVARLMGDGLLAFFGAPIGHEDDPQRAVLAGLEMIENISRYKQEISAQWRVEIDVRVGINTGLVVVGAVGSDLQVEYSALGDAINVAARMEQTARPGTVQVSDETYRLIAPLFDFEDLGLVQVKGKTEPVHTYRPLRLKPAPGRMRGIEGLEAPTIGRKKEIQLLQTALQNLTEHGVGSLLFLTGEAGMGKSRLIRELKIENRESRIENRESRIENPDLRSSILDSRFTCYELAPLSFEASQPYALFRCFLRLLTGVREMDSVEAARPKLAALAERLPVEVRGGVTGAFASVLGVADAAGADGESFKRQLFATARETVRVQFAEKPGIIILDDLHWADPASLAIFNHLFPLVETVPILFLCATRPEREAPVWQLKTTLADEYPHRFVEIPVQPLTPEDSNALVDHLLSVTDLPPRIRAMILSKSEGNPFFLEEIIRTLIDEGVLVRETLPNDGTPHWHLAEEELDTIHIPDSLQTLLAARLDRLTEETRRVLQMASVIGRTFYYRVLQNITDTLHVDGSLATLQRMNMVVEAARLPELEYAFRHTLVQETAYESILRKQRREFHRRVGEAMERLFAARVDEYAPVLAMHFERAEDHTRAFQYYLRAGDVSFRLHAVKEASSHYACALEILKNQNAALTLADADTRRHLCLRLGRALEMGGQYDEALEHYVEMETFAQAQEDRALELAALAARATVHSAPTDQFNRPEAESLSQRALALAEAIGDHAAEAKIYWNLMMMSGFSGDGAQGYEYGSRSLEIARQYDLREQLAYTLHDFHRATLLTGKVDEARTLLDEARQLWQALGNQAMYIDSLISAGLIYIIQGDYTQAEAVCQEALALSREIGNLWGQSYSFYTLGFIYQEQAKLSLALEVMQNALNLVEPSGFAVPLVDCNAFTGWIYGYLGAYERGKVFALDGLRHAKERLPGMQIGPLSILAILEYWQGNFAAMDEWLAGTAPAPSVNSFAGFERFIAECYRLTGKEAYQELVTLANEVIPTIEPMGDLLFLSDILRLVGAAYWKLGCIEEARDFLERSIARSPHAPHHRIDALFTLSQLEAGQGYVEKAKACLVEAQQNIRVILQNVSDPQLQASYLARPTIKAIIEA